MFKNLLMIGLTCLTVLFNTACTTDVVDLSTEKSKEIVEKTTSEGVGSSVNSDTSGDVKEVNATEERTGESASGQITVQRKVELIDFLQKAYDRNPELLSARYTRNAKEAEMMAVMSRFGPNVRLSATAGHDHNALLNGNKNLADQIESLRDTKYDLKGQVSASVNLFRSGSDTFAVMAAEAKQDVYDIEQKGKIQKFLLDAIEIYLNVIKNRNALAKYKDFEWQARHNFERVQTEYVVGSTKRTNVKTAKAELAQAISNRIKAQTELVNAEQAYIEMAGEVAGELVYPKHTLKLPESLDVSMKIAEENNLNLRAGVANLRNARYGLASTVTGMLPSLDAYAEYDKSLKGADLDRGGNGRIGFRLSYELFSNSGQGSHLSQIKQATNTKQAAEYGYEHARDSLIKEVNAAWHGWKTAESQHVQAELGVEAARDAFEGATEEFRLGALAYLDLLKVQEQFLKAELNYLEGVKAKILGPYKVLASQGTLTPDAIGLVVNERDDVNKDS